MEDQREKFIKLYRHYPNKAGKIDQVSATLRRTIESYPKKNLSDQAKAILLSASELVTVLEDYQTFMKAIVDQVFADYEALKEIAHTRDVVNEQAEWIIYFLNKEDEELKKLKAKHDLSRKNS